MIRKRDGQREGWVYVNLPQCTAGTGLKWGLLSWLTQVEYTVSPTPAWIQNLGKMLILEKHYILHGTGLYSIRHLSVGNAGPSRVHTGGLPRRQ